MDERYLKLLSKSSNISNFKILCCLNFGINDLSVFEKDYVERIKNFKIYSDKFLRDKNFSFDECIRSKLPIFINMQILENNRPKTKRYSFYDRNGRFFNIDFNMELFEDVKSIYGIDTESQELNIIKHELEIYMNNK